MKQKIREQEEKSQKRGRERRENSGLGLQWLLQTGGQRQKKGRERMNE